MQFPRPNAVSLGGSIPRAVSLSLPDEPHDDGSAIKVPVPQCAPTGLTTQLVEPVVQSKCGCVSSSSIRDIALDYLASITKRNPEAIRWLSDKGLASNTDSGICPTEKGIELLKTLDYL